MISVIIATTCEKNRGSDLRRAIESVLNQDGITVELLVVVNGKRFDAELLDELRRDPRFTTLYRDEGSFPAAIKYGRQMVSGEFFSYLDDDDIYLPGGLATRLAAIREDPMVDFVATNGCMVIDGAEHSYVRNVEEVLSDPLQACYHGNWLSSAGGLFRSSSISDRFFDGKTKHCEWALLTHRLLMAGKVPRFLDTWTFYKYDTPNSLSKDASVDPILTANRLLEDMIRNADPGRRSVLYHRYCRSLHQTAEYYMHHREFARAWSHHWRSLRQPGGIRFLTFTARLLANCLTPRRARVLSRAETTDR